MSEIHPTAIVDPGARLGADLLIGPYCIVGPGVELGDGCRLDHHVSIRGPAKIGKNNRFYHGGSIGEQSQDLKYRGEPTHLLVGDDNCFREFVTVHRGTLPDTTTRIGSRGNFLAYSHIAHDCTVGDDVISSNNGTLAGHVEVGDRAVIGGLTAIHQFCRIGAFALTGGCSKIVQDVPPFTIADGNPAEIRGVNVVGLERGGMSADQIRNIKRAYRILFRSGLNTRDAIERLRSEDPTPEALFLAGFAETSQRGILRAQKKSKQTAADECSPKRQEARDGQL